MKHRSLMRFLADMGLDVRVVDWLRERGHDAKHLREEGLHRLPNGLIFRKAIAESRIVLAFDLDFGEIAAQMAGHPASVILFRLRNTRTANVIRRLSTVLVDASDTFERGGCRRGVATPGEGIPHQPAWIPGIMPSRPDSPPKPRSSNTLASRALTASQPWT